MTPLPALESLRQLRDTRSVPCSDYNLEGVFILSSQDWANNIAAKRRFQLGESHMVIGWPNPILEHARQDPSVDPQWLQVTDTLADQGLSAGTPFSRPQFNMVIFQDPEDGSFHRIAVYGPLSDDNFTNPMWTIFNEAIRRCPSEWVHMTTVFRS